MLRWLLPEMLRRLLPEMLRRLLPEILRRLLPEILRWLLPEILRWLLPEILRWLLPEIDWRVCSWVSAACSEVLQKAIADNAITSGPAKTLCSDLTVVIFTFTPKSKCTACQIP
jgi:hypothetical protein